MRENSNQIRIARNMRKLKQSELASKVNVSSQVISNWERGYTDPGGDDIRRLSEALDVSTDFLLGKTADPGSSSVNETREKYDSFAEVKKIVDEAGITGFFMKNKKDWENLTPDEVEEFREDIEEYMDFKLTNVKKKRKEESD